MNPEKPVDDNKDIIELTQVVKPKPQPANTGEQQDRTPSTEDLTRFDEKDNDLGKLAAEVVGDVTSGANGEKPKSGGSGKIPMERIEAALERVVRKLYSKKIEDMVLDIVEKTVKEEISKIKDIIKERK